MLFDFLGEPLRDGQIGLHFVADELDVDRRGHAEVQDLADDIRGLEEKSSPGNCFGSSARNCVM